MLLAIDVGNTNIVFGFFKDDQLMGEFRLTSTQERTSDEIGFAMLQYLQTRQMTVAEIEDVIISSVVPKFLPILKHTSKKYCQKTALIIDEDIFPSLKYQAEERLGADRSVACEAAMKKYGKPLIVLDLGTATTIDTVSETGWYMGGSILTGLRLVERALSNHTAQLPPIPLHKPKTVLGFDAIGQIQAGIVTSYVGGIDFLIRKTKEEMDIKDGVKIIATGGFSHFIAEQSDFIDIVDSQLILDGLNILYQTYKEENR